MPTTEKKPAWQTEELADEWVESVGDQGEAILHRSASCQQDIFTISNGRFDDTVGTVHIWSPHDRSPTSVGTAGTFIVHADEPHTPFVPLAPGRKKGIIKDFFSPLALETMFEPPSPPRLPADSEPSTAPATVAPAQCHTSLAPRLSPIKLPTQEVESRSDEIIASDIPGLVAFDGRKPSNSYKFTFTIPRSPPKGTKPNATPSIDSRLRLFQFQYDTYTRDHLSALVDSIPVNNSSGHSDLDQSLHTRSAKRIKLSPQHEEDRPPRRSNASGITRRDYIGESRLLMQQIKQNPSFSIASIATQSFGEDISDADDRLRRTPATPLPIICPNPDNNLQEALSSNPAPSSLAFRSRAEDLMARIKSDHHRVFSWESEKSTTDHIRPKVGASTMGNDNDDGINQANVLPAPRDLQRAAFSRPYATTASRQPSPRKLLRRISAADEVDRELQLSNSLSSKPNVSVAAPLAPISSPSQIQLINSSQNPTQLQARVLASTIRPNDDLNRFVSSSSNGESGSGASAASGVKHAGPPALPHITRISPEDVPVLPERVGHMVFDKKLMKWSKVGLETRSEVLEEEDSEDPFRDFESLKDDSSPLNSRSGDQCVEADVVSDSQDLDEEPEEEIETSFSFDGKPSEGGITTVGEDELSDSADEGTQSGYNMPPIPPNCVYSPVTAGQHLRPVLKPSSVTPVSALKDPRYTPRQALSALGHRRSVSFSDGLMNGKIQGLEEDQDEEVETEGSMLHASCSDAQFCPSARSKRIASILGALDDSRSFQNTKVPSQPDASLEVLVKYTKATDQDSPIANPNNSSAGLRPFNRSHSLAGPNATFLTECSFGVAHDRLVRSITDVQPYEPHWENLKTIDLSGKNIESAARLKEFLPHLDVLHMNSNQLEWLSGIPSTVRTLCVASNILTGLTSYIHLRLLEHLDISRNQIDSLKQLECLHHLRELKADYNLISDLHGLANLDGLIKLSLRGNSLGTLDLTDFKLPHLEVLNLGENQIKHISGLPSLSALVVVNLDYNRLENFEVSAIMAKMRILRLSGNRLTRLYLAAFPNLRTLYADNNRLGNVLRADRLTKLENLSLRNQNGNGLNLPTRDIRDVKRLYLSGNPLDGQFLQEACYNLIYLELAACRLSSLPVDLVHLIPNIRVLNLNYNFISDAHPLHGLTRLRKLTIIGSRLKGTKPLIKILRQMPNIEMLDFRMNPCTLAWYLPLLVKDVPGALQPAETSHETTWQDLDAKFRRDLPDDSYIGRLAYRGLILHACTRIKTLDGVRVTAPEREKAMKLLKGICSAPCK